MYRKIFRPFFATIREWRKIDFKVYCRRLQKMVKKTAEKKEKKQRQTFQIAKHTEITKLLNDVCAEVTKWKKHLLKEGNKYPKDAKIPDKKDFKNLKAEIKDCAHMYVSLCKLKRRDQVCTFNRPLFINKEATEFILNIKDESGNFAKNFSKNIDLKKETKTGLYLMSANMFKKTMIAYATKIEDLQNMSDYPEHIALNSALLKLLKTQYPNIEDEDKVNELPEDGEDGMLYATEGKGKDVVAVSKSYFKVLLGAFIINDLPPQVISEVTTHRIKDQEFYLDKLLGNKKKEEVNVEPITIKEFDEKIRAIADTINRFKNTFYQKDENNKEFKKDGHYPKDAPGKKDFITQRKIVNEVYDHYEHKYRTVFKDKMSKTKESGFNRVVKIPMNLAKLLKLDKLGFPKEGTHMFVTSALITSLVSLYVESKGLKNMEKGKKKLFSADKEMLDVIKDYLKGKTKEGKTYNLDPKALTITDIQKPLSRLQEAAKDHEKKEEILTKAAEISGKRKKQKESKKEIEKISKKIDKSEDHIEIAKNDYKKLPELEEYFKAEKKALEKQKTTIEEEIGKITKEFGF